jgi:hypothetical protein
MQPLSENGLENWPGDISPNLQYTVRPYGTEKGDLDFDFNDSRRSYLVTGILSNCLLERDRPLPEETVWHWSLKKRLQALLAVAVRTRGRQLVLGANCSYSTCGEHIEMPLDLDVFRQDDLEEEFILDIDEKTLRVRLPNGMDQRYWLQHREESLTAIAGKLVLAVDGGEPSEDWHLPEAWLEQLSDALEEYDNLMTLQLNSVCPACGRDLSMAVDLETQLLSSLFRVQQNLLLDIHALALAYHWTERDILELPPQRRNFYLLQLREDRDEVLPQ